MAMTMHVDIVSAEAEIFSGKATMLFAPAVMGEVGVMPQHAPLLTKIKPGEVRVVIDGKEEELFYVSGGMLEIQPSGVTILADTALRAWGGKLAGNTVRIATLLHATEVVPDRMPNDVPVEPPPTTINDPVDPPDF